MLITIEVSAGIRDRLAKIADRRRVSIAQALSQLVAEEEAREHGVPGASTSAMTNLRRERTRERGRGERDGETPTPDEWP